MERLEEIKKKLVSADKPYTDEEAIKDIIWLIYAVEGYQNQGNETDKTFEEAIEVIKDKVKKIKKLDFHVYDGDNSNTIREKDRIYGKIIGLEEVLELLEGEEEDEIMEFDI